MPGHANLAAADLQQSAQHPEGSAFASAVGTEQTENLAALHLESETLDRLEISEKFLKILGLNHHFFIPD